MEEKWTGCSYIIHTMNACCSLLNVIRAYIGVVYNMETNGVMSKICRIEPNFCMAGCIYKGKMMVCVCFCSFIEKFLVSMIR